MQTKSLLLGVTGFCLACSFLEAASANLAARLLPREVLTDKIRGGWAGQMIGVSYGAPTEFKAKGKMGDWDLKWSPERVENSIHQDDLYVEMTFSKVLDTVGLKATSVDFGEAFKTSQYSLWHANAGARRALNQGIKAPWSGHPKYNIHANDIDFQIEADFIGLMCPGLPQVSNEYCDRVGRVMNYGDGLYGGMFVCGMYAAAYFENDPRKITEAGLACIPAKSTYAALIRDLLTWSAQFPDDWRKVWQLIEDKWDKDDPCPDGAMTPFNIDAKLNGAYIALGLLFGKGDFLKTMEIATRCGQDSDCNPSSAVGVLGVMLGYDKIPAEYKSGIAKIANTKFEFTDYSYNEICQSTEKLALQLIQKAGGKVDGPSVLVPIQAPKVPKLEQWDPGIPVKKVGVKDSAWQFSGTWKDEKNTMMSSEAGALVSFTFDGVAVAILGRLNQEGGRAEVWVDGKKTAVADAYIVERTHDNVLWHIYGLKPGSHIIGLIVSGEADARSKGRQISIQQAVVYQAR
jgi:hypothetical protein